VKVEEIEDRFPKCWKLWKKWNKEGFLFNEKAFDFFDKHKVFINIVYNEGEFLLNVDPDDKWEAYNSRNKAKKAGIKRALQILEILTKNENRNTDSRMEAAGDNKNIR